MPKIFLMHMDIYINVAVKRELKINVWEQAPDKGFKATRGIRLNMRKVKKWVTDKILRKAGMYGWKRRMPGGDGELISKGRKKTSQI